MAQEYTVKSIAVVQSTRSEATDDKWLLEKADVVLDERIPLEAIEGIEEFSHLEIIFLMNRVSESEICMGKRRPRDNPDYPEIGIFAQRAKARPNRIGSTIVRLLSREGKTLHVEGLDAIDGSPVLDIKPVFREFLPEGEISQPKWASELMKGYW